MQYKYNNGFMEGLIEEISTFTDSESSTGFGWILLCNQCRSVTTRFKTKILVENYSLSH